MISTVMLIRVARNCAFMRAQEPDWPRALCVQDVTGDEGGERERESQELFARGRMEAYAWWMAPACCHVERDWVRSRHARDWNPRVSPPLSLSSCKRSVRAQSHRSHCDSAEILMEYRELRCGMCITNSRPIKMGGSDPPAASPSGNEPHRRFNATSRALALFTAFYVMLNTSPLYSAIIHLRENFRIYSCVLLFAYI